MPPDEGVELPELPDPPESFLGAETDDEGAEATEGVAAGVELVVVADEVGVVGPESFFVEP